MVMTEAGGKRSISSFAAEVQRPALKITAGTSHRSSDAGRPRRASSTFTHSGRMRACPCIICGLSVCFAVQFMLHSKMRMATPSRCANRCCKPLTTSWTTDNATICNGRTLLPNEVVRRAGGFRRSIKCLPRCRKKAHFPQAAHSQSLHCDRFKVAGHSNLQRAMLLSSRPGVHASLPIVRKGVIPPISVIADVSQERARARGSHVLLSCAALLPRDLHTHTHSGLTVFCTSLGL